MKEVKIENKIEKEKVKEEKKEKSIMEQVKDLDEFKRKIEDGNIKIKNVKIPRKLKVKGRKLKAGWIGVLKINENGNASMEKQKVVGSSFRDSDGLYHATDGREKLFWLGKFPFIIQPSWKQNPIRFDPENDENETYGDKYKMAKMLKDTIKVKKGGDKNIIIWIIVGVIVLVGINYFMGGGA